MGKIPQVMNFGTSDQDDTRLVPCYDTRPEPIHVPAQVYNASPARCLIVNDEWAGHIIGALLRFERSDAWEGDNDFAQEQVARIIEQLSKPCGGLIMPIGTVFFHAGDAAPEGTLLCDGASYLASVYPELFIAIGYRFGGSGGDFNVPDMRRRSPFGAENSGQVGDIAGAETVQLTGAQNGPHTHMLMATVVPGAQESNKPNWTANSYAALQTESSGDGAAHENMHPVMFLLPCIVAKP